MQQRNDDPLVEVAQSIAYYEGEGSRAGEPAGSSERGREFEVIVASSFSRTIRHFAQQNHFVVTAGRIGNNTAVKVAHRDKVILFAFAGRETERRLVQGLQVEAPLLQGIDPERLSEWIRMSYAVEIWTNPRLPQLDERGWIPKSDERIVYADDRYQELYAGLTTSFDATIVYLVKQEERYYLHKKCLVECKSAKSSGGERVDGNAHERFSFQNLEYLEIATLYPRCELLLLTNDAYVRYRNKYHSGFGVHALRLSNAFSWYHFRIVTTTEQYLQLFRSWEEWLKDD